jgi:hypothetical protein
MTPSRIKHASMVQCFHTVHWQGDGAICRTVSVEDDLLGADVGSVGPMLGAVPIPL